MNIKASLLLFSLFLANDTLAKTYYFVGTSFPLILEKSQQGEIRGLGADIAKVIGQKLGHQIEIEIYPFSRALRMIETGRADGFIGPYKSEEREKFMIFTQSHFYQDPMAFYVREESDFEWDGHLSSLQGKKIGLTRGWSFGSEFDQYKPKLNIFEVENIDASFRMLLFDRIELFASHPRAANRVIDKLNIREQVKMILPPIIVNKGYFGFSRKRDLGSFIEQFDSELNRMIINGDIQRMNQAYDLYYSSKPQK
ncbi:substrate-binding periplasmic protein [Oceanospirillum beijerinckii]|uniref:substrate-binding periplasmic protein n=1 Tax=Oceanospirillum beijerinckii TaxID=64976 RepID=UPI0003FFBDD3|nr:transporter substrate-binding domain-containing protein [Oceanospirillum beijerinckii]